MRIKLKNPRLFFDEILNDENISLKKFAKNKGISYSNLKKYRRGNSLIPKIIFEQVISYSPNPDYWLKNYEELPSNWGAIKAGKAAALKDKNNLRLKKARRYIKNNQQPININLNEFFCEFYGALLGDGCISKFKRNKKSENKRIVMTIVGNKKLDSSYLLYLKDKLEQEFKISSYFYLVKNVNTSKLIINKKKFALFFCKLGFPIGLKYGKEKIPKQILSLKWPIKKYIIRGLFDTDGSIYARKDEGYRYPIITIRAKDQNLLNEIKRLLKEQGYPAYVSCGNVGIRGSKNIKKWFCDIGSSNNRNLFKYNYWLNKGVLPPKITGS
jgi:hypothetical protein